MLRFEHCNHTHTGKLENHTISTTLLLWHIKILKVARWSTTLIASAEAPTLLSLAEHLNRSVHSKGRENDSESMANIYVCMCMYEYIHTHTHTHTLLVRLVPQLYWNTESRKMEYHTNSFGRGANTSLSRWASQPFCAQQRQRKRHI